MVRLRTHLWAAEKLKLRLHRIGSTKEGRARLDFTIRQDPSLLSPWLTSAAPSQMTLI
jgi:hypothetical protein